MKTIKILFFLTALSLLSCSKLFEDSPFRKGMVSFGLRPYYEGNHIIFKAQIQYGISGKPADIEYIVTDGSQIIESGTIEADIDKTGLKIIFESGLEDAYVPQDTYAGKNIVVFLDPDFKLVADEYMENALEYQTDTLFIPYSF